MAGRTMRRTAALTPGSHPKFVQRYTRSSGALERLMISTWFASPFDFVTRLPGPDRNALLALGRKRSIPKGAEVFHAGSPGEHLYLLGDGRVKIFHQSAGGREIIQWFCFPGEIFGVAEVSRIGPRGVCALACTDSNVIAIGHRAFRTFLRDRPDTAILVIDVLASRLRVLGDMLIDLSADEVRSRLMKLLTRLGARYGKKHGARFILDIPLTHQEIADMIGTSRQTVTTELGRLKREGVLRIEKHCIHIEDPGLRQSLISERETIAPDGAHGA